MKTTPLTADETYALAYEAHYSTGDTLEALRQYAALFTHHPNSQKARDARLQIRNITARLATPPEIVRADVSLALSHITDEVPAWFREMCAPGRAVAEAEETE